MLTVAFCVLVNWISRSRFVGRLAGADAVTVTSRRLAPRCFEMIWTGGLGVHVAVVGVAVAVRGVDVATCVDVATGVDVATVVEVAAGVDVAVAAGDEVGEAVAVAVGDDGSDVGVAVAMLALPFGP